MRLVEVVKVVSVGEHVRHILWAHLSDRGSDEIELIGFSWGVGFDVQSITIGGDKIEDEEVSTKDIGAHLTTILQGDSGITSTLDDATVFNIVKIEVDDVAIIAHDIHEGKIAHIHICPVIK